MASSNQTAVHKLCQWLEQDPVLRADFNADNQKVEGALVSLQNAIDRHKAVVGEYTGTGWSATQTIALGFRPKFVLVLTKENSDGTNVIPVLAVGGASETNVVILDSGFRVTHYQNCTTDGNSYNPYRYVAFRE